LKKLLRLVLYTPDEVPEPEDVQEVEFIIFSSIQITAGSCGKERKLFDQEAVQESISSTFYALFFVRNFGAQNF